MEDNIKEFISESKKVASTYVEAKWKLLRLTAAGKLVHALGLFMSIIIAAMLGFFVVMFLGFLLAIWISDMSGSFSLGFAITALLFIVLLVIALIFRRKLILIPVSNILIRELADEITDENDDDPDEDDEDEDDPVYGI